MESTFTTKQSKLLDKGDDTMNKELPPTRLLIVTLNRGKKILPLFQNPITVALMMWLLVAILLVLEQLAR